jgi:hypothetical protein
MCAPKKMATETGGHFLWWVAPEKLAEQHQVVAVNELRLFDEAK